MANSTLAETLPSGNNILASITGLDQRIAGAAVLLLAMALPLLFRENTYYVRIGVLVLIYFVLTLGCNAVVTTAGLFDLGFTAYFAVGAYACALLLLNTALSYWVVFPMSIAITLAYVWIVSIPILRFRGDYLCIITLAFAEILRMVLNNWLEVTRGPLGLPGIREPQLGPFCFDSLFHYYYFMLVLACGAFWLINRLTHSGVGLRWSSIKENPESAESVGVNTYRAKRGAYLVGAGFAGMAGAAYAPFQGIVDPTLCHMDNSVIILTMVILGGGSNAGILISAAVLTIVPEVLRDLSTYRLLFLGLFFVVAMNVRPAGFQFGVLRHFVLPEWRRKAEKRKQSGGQGCRHLDPGAAAQIIASGLGTPASEAVDRQVVLSGKGVTKRFGGLCAVDNVDFELYKGEVLGLIGPNGAGKTTLFNMITGTFSPTSGNLWLGGGDITGLPPYRIARMGVARTFQIIKLLPNLTVLDNIMIARLENNARGQVQQKKAAADAVGESDLRLVRAVLSYVGLHGQEAILAKNLPFGDQRRLELARALAVQPAILLMDEPASGMNPREVDEWMDQVRRIKEMGISILLIEHNLKVSMALSDRIIVLDHGARIAEGTPEAVRNDRQVIEAYLGGE